MHLTMKAKDIRSGTVVTAPDQLLNLVIVRKEGLVFLAEEKDGKVDKDYEPIPVRSEEDFFDIHFMDVLELEHFVLGLTLSSCMIDMTRKATKGRSEMKAEAKVEEKNC